MHFGQSLGWRLRVMASRVVQKLQPLLHGPLKLFHRTGMWCWNATFNSSWDSKLTARCLSNPLQLCWTSDKCHTCMMQVELPNLWSAYAEYSVCHTHVHSVCANRLCVLHDLTCCALYEVCSFFYRTLPYTTTDCQHNCDNSPLLFLIPMMISSMLGHCLVSYYNDGEVMRVMLQLVLEGALQKTHLWLLAY